MRVLLPVLASVANHPDDSSELKYPPSASQIPRGSRIRMLMEKEPSCSVALHVDLGRKVQVVESIRQYLLVLLTAGVVQVLQRRESSTRWTANNSKGSSRAMSSKAFCCSST